MSGQAYYQKYRSRNFDEVIGQEYVVQSVQNALKEGKVGHAYLFCGPRGTGKTTMARLLARAINCENPSEAPCGKCASCKAAMEGTHPDIIEINAANATGVDDIREIIEKAQLVPMMSKHKVYIIDEVHQLSSSASSALLKILEEPPQHVIFILATTDPQKMLKTIISRCQRFDFSKVDTDKIQMHLLDIAKAEGFTLEDGAAKKIAQLADGGMRDALSILEQANAFSLGNITEKAVDSMYGLASMDEKIGFADDLANGNVEGILIRINDAQAHGIDIPRFTQDLIGMLKDGVIYTLTGKETLLHVLTAAQAKHIAQLFESDRLMEIINQLMDTEVRYKTAQSPSAVLEIACMDIAAKANRKPITETEVPSPKPAKQEEPKEVESLQPVTPMEPKVMEAEPMKPEPQVIEKKYDTDAIINLLVQCTKQAKVEDDVKIQSIVAGMITDKYSAALKKCKLQASGKDCIIFSCKAANANMMNDLPFNEELYRYLKLRGIDKVPFTFTAEELKEATIAFREKMEAHTLPKPVPVQRYQETNAAKEESTESYTKIVNLFGKDQVEVEE